MLEFSSGGSFLGRTHARLGEGEYGLDNFSAPEHGPWVGPLASQASWIGGSADWSSAAHWSGGVPDGDTESAIIAADGTYTVTIAQDESFKVDDLTLDDARARLSISGRLDVSGTLDLTAGKMTLSGTLVGGTLMNAEGAITYSESVLDHVTYEGMLVVAKGGYVSIENGLTLEGSGGIGPGSVKVSGGSEIRFVTNATLRNAVIAIGDGIGSQDGLFTASDTLTLGASTMIEGIGYNVELGDNDSGGTIVNDGTIESDGVYDKLYINPSDFLNKGHILSSAGGSILIGGEYDPDGSIDDTSFSNAAAGTIIIDGDGSAFIEDIFANAGLMRVDSGELAASSITNTGVISEIGIGARAEFDGELSNTGTISVSGQEDQFAAVFSNTGTITLSGRSSVSAIDGNSSNSGSLVFEGTDATLWLNQSFTLTNTGNITLDKSGSLWEDEGEVSGDGTIDLAAGTIDLIDDGTSDGSGTIKGATIIAGAGVLAGHGVLDGTMVEGTLNLEGGAGITVAGGLTLTGASGVGPGAIVLTNSGLKVIDTETLDDGTITLNDSAWLGVAGSKTVLTFGANMNVIGGSGFNGISASAEGTIVNDGVISTAVSSKSLSIAPHIFVNAGIIEDTIGELYIGDGGEAGSSTNAAGGVVDCDPGTTAGFGGHFTNDGTINADGGTVGFSGTLSGSGTINFSGTSTKVNIGSTLSYAGSVTDEGATLSLDGQTLTLSGTTSFANAVIVGYRSSLFLDGQVSADGFSVVNQTFIENEATFDDKGTMTLDELRAAPVKFENAVGATLELDGDVRIDTGATSGSSLINAGSILKDAGPGAAIVEIATTNDGSIAVEAGTLEFEADVAGTGSFAINAGTTLNFTGKVVETQGITFAGGGDADLMIADATGFLASLTGFAPSDTIDLTGFKYHKAESVAFTENSAGTSGVLTVTDGASVLDVTLFGQYVASGFGLETDGAAGTDLTYTPPSSQNALQLATAHH